MLHQQFENSNLGFIVNNEVLYTIVIPPPPPYEEIILYFYNLYNTIFEFMQQFTIRFYIGILFIMCYSWILYFNYTIFMMYNKILKNNNNN